MTYNMHCLTHLIHDVQAFGVLDNIACFPFENFLGQIKQMMRKPNKPLAQVIRRLSEKEAMRTMQSDAEKTLQRPHDNGPVPNGLNVKEQYAKMQFAQFSVQMCTGNNCVQLKNNDVVVVQNLVVEEHGETLIVYKRFRNKTDLFVYPYHHHS